MIEFWLNKVLLFSEFELFNIDFVIIVSSKILIALRALSLPRFISRFQALEFISGCLYLQIVLPCNRKHGSISSESRFSLRYCKLGTLAFSGSAQFARSGPYRSYHSSINVKATLFMIVHPTLPLFLSM